MWSVVCSFLCGLFEVGGDVCGCVFCGCLSVMNPSAAGWFLQRWGSFLDFFGKEEEEEPPHPVSLRSTTFSPGGEKERGRNVVPGIVCQPRRLGLRRGDWEGVGVRGGVGAGCGSGAGGEEAPIVGEGSGGVRGVGSGWGCGSVVGGGVGWLIGDAKIMRPLAVWMALETIASMVDPIACSALSTTIMVPSSR